MYSLLLLFCCCCCIFFNQERKNKTNFSFTINLIILISKYDLSTFLSNLTEKKRVLFVCLLLNYSDFFFSSCHICTAVLIDSTRLMISVCYYVWYMFLSFSYFCSGIHHLARVGSTFHRLFALDHISTIIIHSANRHLLIQAKKNNNSSGPHFFKKTINAIQT